jgi:hypothetical protein
MVASVLVLHPAHARVAAVERGCIATVERA